MKKLLILATIVIFGAGLAFAHGPGFGRGYGMGPGMMGPGAGYGYGPGYQKGFRGYGPGFCMGYGANYYQGNVKQVTEKEAKEAVEKILKENFKGYEVEEVEKFRMPMGTMYEVDVKDTAGNKFEFHVNPWGYVMGPFPDYDVE